MGISTLNKEVDDLPDKAFDVLPKPGDDAHDGPDARDSPEIQIFHSAASRFGNEAEVIAVVSVHVDEDTTERDQVQTNGSETGGMARWEISGAG